MDGQTFMSLMNSPGPVGGLLCIHYAQTLASEIQSGQCFPSDSWIP